MSITTKKGDEGMTDLMYGRRISKTEIRLEAGGAIDELNAALGVARAVADCSPEARDAIGGIQRELIGAMGELATLEEDLELYVEGGHARVSAAMVERLTELGARYEIEGSASADWAIPGDKGSLAGAQLDYARTVCRRAEREVAGLIECLEIANGEMLKYFNRLSDVLWLMARAEENRS
ncbi:MAG: cob(I)yrinic acid a,c-diamide adenosyltransferase [Verrucomicrobiales bacterium]